MLMCLTPDNICGDLHWEDRMLVLDPGFRN